MASNRKKVPAPSEPGGAYPSVLTVEDIRALDAGGGARDTTIVIYDIPSEIFEQVMYAITFMSQKYYAPRGWPVPALDSIELAAYDEFYGSPNGRPIYIAARGANGKGLKGAPIPAPGPSFLPYNGFAGSLIPIVTAEE